MNVDVGTVVFNIVFNELTTTVTNETDQNKESNFIFPEFYWRRPKKKMIFDLVEILFEL